MNSFIYDVGTKIYFGENATDNLSVELKNYSKRVLLCYGGGSIKKSGLYDRIMTQAEKAGCEVFELSGIEPNPRIDSVREGAKICKEQNIGFIAMKPLAGGAIEDGSIAVRYICANPNVTVVIPGMYDLKEIDQNLAAAENTAPLTEEEQAKIDGLPKSLGEALDALEWDHEYLTRGGVFPERLIQIWLKKKRAELEELNRIPTPAEFKMYYDL